MAEPFPQSTDIDNGIPDKCKDCGVQCSLAAYITILSFAKTQGEELGALTMDQQFSYAVNRVVPADETDNFIRFMQQGVVNGLDTIDEQIEKTQAKIRANAETCTGSFKVRAVKDEVTYTLGVCTSTKAYESSNDEGAHIPTHVEVKRSGRY